MSKKISKEDYITSCNLEASLDELGLIVVSCDCGEEECSGWMLMRKYDYWVFKGMEIQ